MWKEEEYLRYLEIKGTDVVCFMGSGYNFEDYPVGQEFYYPFGWYEPQADLGRGFNIEQCIVFAKMYYGRNIFDRFRLVKKYRFRLNVFCGSKRREEYCLVQNIRTEEVFHLREEEVDKFYYLLMAEPF